MTEEFIATETIEKPDFFEAIRDAVQGIFGIPPIPNEITEQLTKTLRDLHAAKHNRNEDQRRLNEQNSEPIRLGEALYEALTISDKKYEKAYESYLSAQDSYEKAKKMFGGDGRFAQRTKWKF